MKKLTRGENITLETQDYVKANIEQMSDRNVDLSVLLLTNEKLIDESHFIYFNNKFKDFIKLDESKNLATIELKFNLLPKNIDKVLIVSTGVVKITNINFSLGNSASFVIDDITNELSIIVGEFYLRNNLWKFRAMGMGFNKGLEAIAEYYGLDLSKLSKDEKEEKFRKKSSDVINEYCSNIKDNLKKYKNSIDSAITNKYNESDTRMILDRIFTDVLGYKIDEIKTEQKISGRRADYVLSVNETDYIVVEVKKAGMPLKDKQVFQATSYGAYSGIKLVVLTNLQNWQLYYINSNIKVESELLFDISVDNLSDENINFLFLISRNGITRKHLLQKLRDKNRMLSASSLISILFTDDILNKIRLSLNKDSLHKATNEEVKQALEQLLNL